MAQKVYYEPIRYEIGKDLSAERYHEILANLTAWIARTRRTKEPGLVAKQELDECMAGLKKDGTKWHGAWNTTLASRVRIRCRFDIDTLEGIESASDRTKKRKEKERERLERKRRAVKHDELIPEEVVQALEKNNKDLRSTAKYGDDPSIFLSTREQQNWNRYKEDYIRQFPEELGSIAAQAELDTLCDLHILNERHRMKLLKGQAVDPMERQSVVKQLDTLKTSLGIHPNQIAKRVKSKSDTTLSAAARRLEEFDNWRKIKARFWVEEMLQMFQMYNQPSADGLGFQLDDIGLYGLTKCRTCACAACGQRNAVGIKYEEIEAYLRQHGHIEPLDADTD